MFFFLRLFFPLLLLILHFLFFVLIKILLLLFLRVRRRLPKVQATQRKPTRLLTSLTLLNAAATGVHDC